MLNNGVGVNTTKHPSGGTWSLKCRGVQIPCIYGIFTKIYYANIMGQVGAHTYSYLGANITYKYI